jgi:hypothetical protein
MFLVGGGVGSAVIGGLAHPLGMAGALLLLALLPVLGLFAILKHLPLARFTSR